MSLDEDERASLGSEHGMPAPGRSSSEDELLECCLKTKELADDEAHDLGSDCLSGVRSRPQKNEESDRGTTATRLGSGTLQHGRHFTQIGVSTQVEEPRLPALAGGFAARRCPTSRRRTKNQNETARDQHSTW